MIQLTVFRLAGMGLPQHRMLCSLCIVQGDCYAFRQAYCEILIFPDVLFWLVVLACVACGY